MAFFCGANNGLSVGSGTLGAVRRRLWLPALLGLGLSSLTGAPTLRNFDLPAGPAEQMLDRFALQSGLQVIFPSAQVKPVYTSAVHGRFTPREALDRLVAGTSLVVEIDERTGIMAIVVVETVSELVRLPPYLVESGSATWRYARVGRFEVLSACTESATHRAIEQIHRLHEALGLLLPEEFQARLAVSELYVLHSDHRDLKLSEELMTEIRRLGEGRMTSLMHDAVGGSGGWLKRNHAFWDYDGHATYLKVDEAGLLNGQLTLGAEYLRNVLERRVPALPPWLIEGMMELYRITTLDPYGVKSPMFEVREGNEGRPGGVARVAPGRTVFSSLVGRDEGMLPMAKLLAADPPAREAPEYVRWRAQAALFVRWALEGKRQAALWDYVRQSERAAPGETDFQRVFQFDYAQMDDELRRYLPKARRQAFELRPRQFADDPPYVLWSAGELEIGWVKGDLDRLKMGYVRRHFPGLTPHYAEQTRRILERAHAKAPEDARLLGLLGLFECDAGNDEAARPWLEAAVVARVSRPRVYWELARIRLLALRNHPEEVLPPPGEIAAIIDLLNIARTQSPPQAMTYELLAEVWNAYAIVLHRQQLAVLDEGLSYFPRRIALIASVARLNARHGFVAEAQTILERALNLTTDPINRQWLLSLRKEISSYAERVDRSVFAVRD